mgnify:CR=1 FL=1
MRIEPGAILPPRRIEFVSPATMKTWAPILHDPNPIHLDRDAVAAKGLGNRLINQGPINVGYCMDMLLAAFPGSVIESMSSRFIDNVYEGDAVTATGIVASVTSRGGALAVEVDFQLKADERDIVIAGKATVITAQETMA